MARAYAVLNEERMEIESFGFFGQTLFSTEEKARERADMDHHTVVKLTEA